MAKPDSKAIRLLMPIRAGKEVIPENAVLDATTEVADELIGRECAEETDAIERYPTVQLLAHFDDAPVTGAEKFPIRPGEEPIVPPGMFETEVDRKARNRAKAEGPVLLPGTKPEAPVHTGPKGEGHKAEDRPHKPGEPEAHKAKP
jgi:hypothetical protein